MDQELNRDNLNAEEQDMGTLLKEYDNAISNLHKGSVTTGTVVSESESGWLVDVGFKCEGFLPVKEWTHHSIIEDTEKPKVGDEIEVEVVNIRHGEEAQLTLSRWRHELDKRWNALDEALAKSDILTVKGTSKVKGGVMVNCCGLEGFIPASHLAGKDRNVDLDSFIGRTFEVKALEKDRRKHRLVLSRNDLVKQEEERKRAAFYEKVHEGDVLEGEVSSLTDFGVFVTIGEMDGLVHMSELSWKRSVKIRDMFKKGDKVKVKVIGIDKEKNRISLSIKQTEDDPWLTVADRIHVNDVVKGAVTHMTDFGAFVELEPGIEGLIHIGDISWTRIQKPRDVFKRGQEVEVIVLEVDTAKRRISLGYKQLNDPWRDIDKRYATGQDINVKVVRLADFGAFVEVEEGVEALIHISQLSTKRVEKPSDVLKEGQEVTVRVIEVNPTQRRMRLSLSALEEPEVQPEPEQPAAAEAGAEVETAAADTAAKPQAQAKPQAKAQGKGKRSRSASGAKTVKAPKETTAFEDDGGLSYNPFAEAFKDQNFNF
ncbi:MAG: S1 RNA-binding domain-containing protein [Synergistaceae bacterium]|nr:S1 RNA-binding domain-containing protein [Synergistaceae bacterium]